MSAWPRRRFSRFCALRAWTRLDRGDRATDKDPVRRYVRDTPGELIHADIKEPTAIPDRGGHRTRGRSYPGQHTRRRVGCRFIHSALNDRSRLAYPGSTTTKEPSPQPGSGHEQRPGSAPAASPASNASSPTTDPATAAANGAKPATAPAPPTSAPRPYRSQTNGKLSASTASSSKNGPTSDTGPQNPTPIRLHRLHPPLQPPPINHHRFHGALKRATPASTLNDNLPPGQPPRRAHLGGRLVGVR